MIILFAFVTVIHPKTPGLPGISPQYVSPTLYCGTLFVYIPGWDWKKVSETKPVGVGNGVNPFNIKNGVVVTTGFEGTGVNMGEKPIPVSGFRFISVVSTGVGV